MHVYIDQKLNLKTN